ncbi:glycosyltransferase family 39 protein [Phreatobacter oligotrophus]|uniref:Dolichyl-phosphate-mannose-protein mannosyltransferase n=1 Tax=Phreatobacter oligotrophus TaxID=1122261 RepID=A0A2T4YZD8_9HYPH|nr:glycosyltransferase family 39 protein [Phreatobacter oligotrophus]PTM52346.1 dolichyl-phosphate-mannose-protein mannosyltransferase [Phreatobacter oligotrophus]
MPLPPPSSGAAEPPPPVWAGSARAVILLVAVLTAIRLVAAGHLGLAADEAYYWIWSKNLAFGYFDHPPMVAVLVRASTAVFGDSPFGIRWLSVLLGAAASLGAWRLVWRLTDDRIAAVWAAGLVQATLFLGAGALLVTPDTPLVLFWTLALLALAELWRTGRGVWWLAVGLCVGLAFVSKYTAVFLGPAILLWLALVPELRRWFRSPWPYAGGVLCLAVMAPVIAWNLAQGGASLTKQFGRAVPKAFDPRFVPEFIAGQAALLTPLIGLLVVWGLWVALRRTIRDRSPGETLITVSVLPLVAYLVWYGLFDRVQGNWTACLLPASIAAAVMGARALPAAGPLAAVLRASLRWSVVTGVVLGLLLLLHAAFRIAPLAVDPTGQLHGWPEAAREVQAAANTAGAAVIGTASYTTTAHLRFYGSGRPPVVQFGERARYVMEPAFDPAVLAGRPVLVAVESRRVAEVEQRLKRLYGSVTPAGVVERRWRERYGLAATVDSLHLFLARDPVAAGLPDLAQ